MNLDGYAECCYSECNLCWVPIKSIMLSVIMVNIIMLSGIMLNVVARLLKQCWYVSLSKNKSIETFQIFLFKFVF